MAGPRGVPGPKASPGLPRPAADGRAAAPDATTPAAATRVGGVSPAIRNAPDVRREEAPPPSLEGLISEARAALRLGSRRGSRGDSWAPDAVSRLRMLSDEFVIGGSWSALLAIGDIYKNGEYPDWLPDDGWAQAVYRSCAGCPDREVAALGAQRYIEVRVDPVVREDRAGSRLPTGFAEEACQQALEKARNTPFSQWGTPSWQRSSPRGLFRTSSLPAERRVDSASAAAAAESRAVRRSQGMDAMVGALRAFETEISPPARIPGSAVADGRRHFAAPGEFRDPSAAVFTQNKHRSNTQNVHDHGVTSAMKDNIKKVVLAAGGARWGPDEVEGAIDGVTDAVLTSDVIAEEKMLALQLLDDLRRPVSRTPHSAFGVSAPEALCAVWSVIERHRAPSERRDDLVRALSSQLASGIERGVPVCLTGKISRIMGALDGQEDVIEDLGLQKARPMWAVREEMAGLAAKARDDAEANGDPDDDGGAKLFETRALALYAGELGMSESVIEPLVREFALGF